MHHIMKSSFTPSILKRRNRVGHARAELRLLIRAILALGRMRPPPAFWCFVIFLGYSPEQPGGCQQADGGDDGHGDKFR